MQINNPPRFISPQLGPRDPHSRLWIIPEDLRFTISTYLPETLLRKITEVFREFQTTLEKADQLAGTEERMNRTATLLVPEEEYEPTQKLIQALLDSLIHKKSLVSAAIIDKNHKIEALWGGDSLPRCPPLQTFRYVLWPGRGKGKETKSLRRVDRKEAIEVVSTD